MTDAQLREAFARLRTEVGKAVVGQDSAVTGLTIALLAGGHVLLEGVPGVAKTLLVRSLSQALSLETKRVQFTPDLMPGDVTGSLVYDAKAGEFEFRPGPVFTNIMLADEINRTPPKTQSALLEAMEERQVSVDGETRKLPVPFMVAATMNPIEYEGTYTLPEAQLDRFLLKEILDYPEFADEIEILDRINDGVYDKHPGDAKPKGAVTIDDVLFLQEVVTKVYLDDSITNYIVSAVYVTRKAESYIGKQLADCIEYGASPRASIAFSRAARALALIEGRDHVIPEDVKELRHVVLRHRIILGFEAIADNVEPETIIDAIFASVKVP